MTVNYTSFSDKGERAHNEDCLMTQEKGNAFLAVLCDGLGGHDSGEVASGCVCECFHEMFSRWDFDTAPEEFLTLCADEAQKRLKIKQSEMNLLSGVRTTMSAFLYDGETAKAMYVGDTRIYRFHGFSINRTTDHSIPEYLVRIKEIREKDIRHHPDRNKLIHVMGADWERAEYQFWDVPRPRAGDAFLLCTDGFWEWIEDAKMNKLRIMTKNADEWLESMKETVLKNGQGHNMDNYSAIAIKLK